MARHVGPALFLPGIAYVSNIREFPRRDAKRKKRLQENRAIPGVVLSLMFIIALFLGVSSWVWSLCWGIVCHKQHICNMTYHNVYSFQTGSGQTGSSQKCRNSLMSIMWTCMQKVTTYDKPLQHYYYKMFRFRMWGFNILHSNPSPISALGVKSPHLELLRVNKLLCLNPTSSDTASLNSHRRKGGVAWRLRSKQRGNLERGISIAKLLLVANWWSLGNLLL